ncbi:protein RoBo-1-like [Bombina bombina]|uniref:protein RoBo-1-like n=1 Tax=Bombina bombina TaxID=8345 RepID=UPI00235B2122|nr:protein RoBo-1-like [Bombina bombina]
MQLQIMYTCCRTELCNPPRPTAGNTNTTFNGVICPVCLSLGDSCEATETMSCTGLQTKCVNSILSSTVISDDLGVTTHMSARGCATRDICDYSISAYMQNNTLTQLDVICTP